MSDEVKPDEPQAPSTLMMALLAAQAEIPKLEKAAVNPHFKSKYISLDTIMAEVLPVLNRHGLIWVTRPAYDASTDELVLLYDLIHAETAERLEGRMKLLAAKDDPQGQGAAITYARRYAITAVLGISADEDDDGNRAAAARQASRQRQQEARHGGLELDSDQLARMTEAIREKGFEPAEIMERAGIAEPLHVTVAQAQKVRDILAAA